MNSYWIYTRTKIKSTIVGKLVRNILDVFFLKCVYESDVECECLSHLDFCRVPKLENLLDSEGGKQIDILRSDSTSEARGTRASKMMIIDKMRRMY